MHHSENRLERRAKNHDRLQEFYKRQLDRKGKLANELRGELNEAKKKLAAIEYSTKKSQRLHDVARVDQNREQKNVVASLAKQVGKVATLLSNVRGMRAQAATTNTRLACTAARREARQANGNLVRFVIFLFACFLT